MEYLVVILLSVCTYSKAKCQEEEPREGRGGPGRGRLWRSFVEWNGRQWGGGNGRSGGGDWDTTNYLPCEEPSKTVSESFSNRVWATSIFSLQFIFQFKLEIFENYYEIPENRIIRIAGRKKFNLLSFLFKIAGLMWESERPPLLTLPPPKPPRRPTRPNHPPPKKPGL